jgi:gas vesicle protein
MAKKRPFISGILIGGAVGAVAALLMAPKSGKELRKDLQKWYKLMEKDVDSTLTRVKSVSQSTYKATVDKVIAAYDKVKDLSKDDLEKIREQLLAKWNHALEKQVSAPESEPVAKATKTVKKAVKKTTKK